MPNDCISHISNTTQAWHELALLLKTHVIEDMNQNSLFHSKKHPFLSPLKVRLLRTFQSANELQALENRN
jgi:ABC-type dipeptide/oligopeptide/nickel transport system ATPase component